MTTIGPRLPGNSLALAGLVAAGSVCAHRPFGLRRVRTFYYGDSDLMPAADHGDYVYELTRSDWTSQANR